MRIAALALLILMIAPGGAGAQVGPKTQRRPPSDQPVEVRPSDVRGSPPISGQVYLGERAPDFELDGPDGHSVKLSRLRGDWVVLAFADRAKGLTALRDLETKLRLEGARYVGVYHEKAHTLKSVAERDTIPFQMLADATGQVSAAYGLYDFTRSETRPGFVVLDRQGYVRFAVLGQVLPADDILHLVEFVVAVPGGAAEP